MLAVALALTASACWGVADFIAGMASRRLSAILVLLVQQAVGAAIAVAIVLVAGEGPPGERAVVLSMLAGAAGAMALGAFYRALALGTMSVVAPISASGAVLPVAVGIATGDRPGALQAAGLALTFAGVILASREVHEGESAAGSRASIALALVAAGGLGLFFTFSDGAADESVLWLLIISRSTAVVLLLSAGLVAGGLVRPGGRDLRTLALIGVLDLAATGLYALANTQGLLSVVAVVGSLYPVTTVLLARAVLHERLQRPQAVGIALAFTGVAAVVGGS